MGGVEELEMRLNVKMKHVDENGDVIGEKTTNTFGSVEFVETTRSSKGKFVRFSNETNPATIYEMMKDYWKMPRPRLLISVTGGAKSLNIDAELKQKFKDGLLKVAQTAGTWVISGGTNTGVMKLVGDAMNGTNNTCIGIVTWGVIANRESLVAVPDEAIGGTFPYHLGSYLLENGVFLDYNHSHFLLVDDGSDWKFGREIEFRGKFEDYVMNNAGDGRCVPTVLIVLEGGPGTLGTVYSAINNKTPVPCVVIEGSGRCADLLVYAMENSDEISKTMESEEGTEHEGLMAVIKETLTPKEEDRKAIYDKVIKCVQKKESVRK